MSDRNDPPARSEVERWFVKGDEHAETDRHRRRPERQRKAEIEDPSDTSAAVHHDERGQKPDEHGERRRHNSEDHRVPQCRGCRCRKLPRPLTERFVMVEAVAPTGGERPLDQYTDRSAEQHQADDEVAATPRRGCGTTTRPGAPTDDRATAFQPGREDHEGQNGDKLQGGQRSGGLEVDAGDRLPIDLGLDRCSPRPAEDQHHTERREREQEDDCCGRGDSGAQPRERDLPEGLPRPRSEHTGRLLHALVEAGPVGTHRPNDDRIVEEHVGDQDRPDGVTKPKRAVIESDNGEHLGERTGDDNRRQHERHGDERPSESLTSRRQPGDDRRSGKSDGEREHGARDRLPDREQGDVALTRRRSQIEKGLASPTAEAAPQDRGDRVEKERCDEHGGDDHQHSTSAEAEQPVHCTLLQVRTFSPGRSRPIARPMRHGLLRRRPVRWSGDRRQSRRTRRTQRATLRPRVPGTRTC